MIRAVFLLLVVPLAAFAETDHQWRGHGHDHDHDRARAARERGGILPLDAILKAAAQDVPGEVIELELEREDGRWIYELYIRTESGRLVEHEVDAATGRAPRPVYDDDDDEERDD
ncbi:PepSY domain-containing protein [Rhodovulum adriaticum]|uniref:Putative membrane protein YkoI n=1 Tax=Rhodovulum adriaticum TaxID=35804 RepID=A0A4R2NN33_RHOAD|nr:PepSY domain-containing protein [Rhodovulum adriaticum]MBK1634580.1 hypothetical protein [Rhodovulum adriaticum]TCP23050.1 putative membrane protein YkoI [Rhodovulum adriaticum]